MSDSIGRGITFAGDMIANFISPNKGTDVMYRIDCYDQFNHVARRIDLSVQSEDDAYKAFDEHADRFRSEGMSWCEDVEDHSEFAMIKLMKSGRGIAEGSEEGISWAYINSGYRVSLITDDYHGWSGPHYEDYQFFHFRTEESARKFISDDLIPMIKDACNPSDAWSLPVGMIMHIGIQRYDRKEGWVWVCGSEEIDSPTFGSDIENFEEINSLEWDDISRQFPFTD